MPPLAPGPPVTAERLTSRTWPVLGLYARPRSVLPVVTHLGQFASPLVAAGGMVQSCCRMFSTTKDQTLVRRLAPASVKANCTQLLELSARLAG